MRILADRAGGRHALASRQLSHGPGASGETVPIRDQEIIIRRQDGSEVLVAPYPTPIRDETGAVAGALNVLIDITRIKSEREAAVADRVAMECRVEEFTAQIAHVRKMEAVGQLASGMAHDFNNVLQGVGELPDRSGAAHR